MTLTEKVRAKLNNGVQMCVYEVTALSAGANVISAEAMGLNQVIISEFRHNIARLTAPAITMPGLMTTYSGKTVTITTAFDGDAGSVIAYGY